MNRRSHRINCGRPDLISNVFDRYQSSWERYFESRRPRLVFLSPSIIHRENLVSIFKQIKAGKAPGIDGVRAEDVSVGEFGPIAGMVCEMIRAGTWRPNRSRPSRLPKPNGGTRPISIRCLVDKIVSAAVSESLTLNLESHLFPTSFAYRPHKSVQHMLATIAFLIEREHRYVIAHADIRQAFENVRISQVITDFHALFVHPLERPLATEQIRENKETIQNQINDRYRFGQLTETILRGFSRSEVGIEQGDPLSPPVLNLRMHRCLDLPSPRTIGSVGTVRLRYSDDNAYLGRTELEVISSIEEDDVMLRSSGLEFKRRNGGAPFRPVDLRRQNSSIEVLGHIVSLNNGHVEFGIGRDKYHQLRIRLNECHGSEYPVACAQSVVNGWIASHGATFENGISPCLDRLSGSLAECSFHELVRPEVIIGEMEKALQTWRSVRAQVSSQMFGQWPAGRSRPQ